MKKMTLLFSLCALPLFAQSKAPTAVVERGAYLVRVGGCVDCHTPKTASIEPDGARLLAGSPSNAPAPSTPINLGEVVSSASSTAFDGPWGISYGAHLAPGP